MRYENVQNLKDEAFKRSTGVSRAMFEKMLTVVKKGFARFWPKTKV